MENKKSGNEEEEHHKEDSGTITLKKDTIWKVATVVFALLFILSIYTGGFGIRNKTTGTGSVIAPINDNNNNGDAGNNPSNPSAKVDVSSDDDAVLGNKNAPITMIEFSDYECPFCGRHFTQTYPQLKQEYIDTGKVKLVFRDFPLSFHQNAQKAAEAAECAGEQGDAAYFRMHDKLFQNQDSLSVENYKKWAKEIGLDATKFNSCLDSGKMASEISKDMADGSKYGGQGTPAFFINGKLVSGAQPFSAFKQAIDVELNA